MFQLITPVIYFYLIFNTMRDRCEIIYRKIIKKFCALKKTFYICTRI